MNNELTDKIMFYLSSFCLFIWFGRYAWTVIRYGKLYAEFSQAIRGVSEDTWKYLFPYAPRHDVRTWGRWQKLVEEGFLEKHPEIQSYASNFEWYMGLMNQRLTEGIFYAVGVCSASVIYGVFLRPA